MGRYKKTIMSHHKRNHNGRQRARKDDVRVQEDRTYFRPCGCRPDAVAKRNQSIALAIKTSKPTMEWNALLGCWVPHVSNSIKRRFGRCMRHFDLEKDLKMEETPTPEEAKPSDTAIRAAASA
jgi:hypothetical protein